MKLTVILADTWRTTMAARFEGDHFPYQKRTVQVELTPQQVETIKPRKVGVSGDVDVHEEIFDAFLED